MFFFACGCDASEMIFQAIHVCGIAGIGVDNLKHIGRNGMRIKMNSKTARTESGLNMRIASIKASIVFFCLLALGLMMSSDAGRVIPSAEAKSSANMPASAPAVQGLTPEQIEAAVEEYFASIGSMDVQRFVNNFAPNGVLEDPVGTPPVQGTQTIAAFFASIIAPFSHIKAKVQEVIPCGQEAAVNWKLNLTTTTGKKITIDGLGVFKFDQSGKLISVREFWDLNAFLAQLQS